MRLIDVDELIKSIEQGEGFSWDNHGKDDLCVRKKYIDNAPTVEPTFGVFKAICCEECEKRPHGEWIRQYGKSYKLITTDEGTLIGEFTKCPKCLYDKARGSNFCPNCGADMRKGGAE